ncbi:hypothetical protein EV363DRAFT_1399384 [Boletus edulis]|uniref:Uncharacterized protein n=1 Tax=Boletus edulis BED1 TaxID=1328754 RepID=A0AAD4BLU7_BOLED|nr:hypothetical protein EV363DRAFT_1399384 [Boletus edulis]KAF8433730.1 hypothetical protein L210DRAFT_947692 [Boletus edulis BED1]
METRMEHIHIRWHSDRMKSRIFENETKEILTLLKLEGCGLGVCKSDVASRTSCGHCAALAAS